MPHRCISRVAWTAQWRPAALGPVDVTLSLYAMAVMAIIRGADYGVGDDADDPSTAVLTSVEAAAPLTVWAVAFLAGGIVLLVGALRRWHGVVWLGHGILSVLYAALAVGILASVLSSPWLDGVRSATVLILPTVMHWTLALRTGPRPLTRGHPTAAILAADGTDATGR